jgi:micrococcal nuclease
MSIVLLLAAAVATPCIDPVAIDGDNVLCGPPGARVNVRLLGIDAPEMPGHCRRGRVCVKGDPFAAKASLARGLRLGPVTYRTMHIDRYQRPDAVVMAGQRNLSCWQIANRAAIYVWKWDAGGAIGRACR